MYSQKIRRFGFFPTLFCLFATLALMAGCGNAASGIGTVHTKAPESQQILRYGDVVSPDIASFDPAQATDAPSLEAIQMVFTGLVELDDNLQVRPQLAQSYDISSDGLTYTFYLRPNLTFSDGTPLTANEVAYSIDRALSPTVANLNGVTLTYLGQIKGAGDRVSGAIPTIIGSGVRVVNQNTIQIIIAQKTAYFLEALTYPTAFVVERSVVEKWGLDHWTDHLNDNGGQGGSGPYVVQSYSHTTGIVFASNPRYYGPQPQMKKVYFDFYKTSETAYNAYLAGQVDLVKNPPSELTDVMKALPNNQYEQSGQLTIDYIGMNYLYKPFDNIHIRQAFALAINKDVITSAIYKGTRIATCHIVPEGMPGYNPHLQCPGGASTSGDIAKAQELFQQGLTEEGLTTSTFPTITITYRANSITVSNSITTMRQEWKQVLGVTVNAQEIDFNALVKETTNTVCQTPTRLAKCLDKGLQMWDIGWVADYPDPQDWLTLQFNKGAANNQGNYGQNLTNQATQQEQQRVQSQLEQADVTENQTARMQMYNQAEQQLVNDVAWLPLDQRTDTRLLKPYVSNMSFNAVDQVPPDDWSNIYITVH